MHDQVSHFCRKATNFSLNPIIFIERRIAKAEPEAFYLPAFPTSTVTDLHVFVLGSHIALGLAG